MEIIIKVLISLALLFLTSFNVFSQNVNVLINENNGNFSKEIDFEIINVDDRIYDYNKLYIIKTDPKKFTLKYRGKEFKLSGVDIGITYNTIYLNLSDKAKQSSYLVNRIKNERSMHKEIFTIDYDSCIDEIYLIDKKLVEYVPMEKFINSKCN